MPVPLSLATLPELPPAVARPRYARAALSPGIVHVGVGNFHRAHLAVYLDDLMGAGLDHDWAIRGAGVRPADEAMRAALQPQDWLSTVVEREGGKSAARVTGAMVDFLPVAPGHGPLIAALAEPSTRIASLTVTEGGYFVDPATGRFDPEHPDIQADVAAPEAPRTVFGALVAGLAARRAGGLGPFTVMSCDNLPGNGHVARAAVLGVAERIDPALAAWIAAEGAFPDSMVDRITPATSERERALVAALGVEDRWPVTCEPFRQWVLEDRFCAGRPRWEEAGAQIVSDVAPFETMKIRILNGGHALIAYAGALLGMTYGFEAMRHPLVRGFLDRVEGSEIIPVVPPVPGADLGAYYEVVARRFDNEAIADTLARLCLDGSNRQPKFVLPSTRDRLARGLPVPGLALGSALWCRFCAGTDEAGRPLALEDEQAERLRRLALAARDEPGRFLEMEDVFGDLAAAEPFRSAFAEALGSLWARGTAATLEGYAAG